MYSFASILARHDQGPDHAGMVKVYYQVQSPEQMRNSVPLTISIPLHNAPIFLAACSPSVDDFACNWESFQLLLFAQAAKVDQH